MRRVGILARIVAVVAMATVAESASAAWVEDPHGDTYGFPSVERADVDITDASYAHSRGRLVHRVKVAGQAVSPERDDVDTLLLIGVADDWGGTYDQCDYYVDRSGDRAGIYRCGTGERVGDARVTRPKGNTLRFAFSARAIGDPSGYDWAVAIRGDANGVRDEFDRLPDGLENFHRHEVR